MIVPGSFGIVLFIIAVLLIGFAGYAVAKWDGQRTKGGKWH